MILLLDVLDTLVRDPFHQEVPALFGLSLPELLAQKAPDTWQRFETGDYDEATFAARYFADGRPLDLDAFRETLRRAYRFLPGVEALLSELRQAGVAMHALSNYPPWYRLIEDELRLSRYLEWSFVSCDTGVRKPDPRAYLGAAERLGVPPGECLFVDDRERNVAGARAIGMQAHRFVDAQDLRAALAARGLLEDA